MNALSLAGLDLGRSELLLVVIVVLLVGLLAHGLASSRRLRHDLADQLEAELDLRHREMLRDLHEGLARQSDRLGEHARADRELLQRGLNLASQQLARGLQTLTQSVDGRLDSLSGLVNQRLDEGFRKTNETFANVMTRLATIDEAQRKIDGLTTNVVSLQELLGDKRARGAFGEVQLETLVENMLPPGAFAFQHGLPNGTRVDCLLNLPEPGGQLAIDAKFPLENYHRMFGAERSEAERRLAARAFRADVRNHVDAIADKYILPGVTADAALMFLPAEAVFAELHAHHGEVVSHAQRRRVWMVSPTTLMAVLNTVRAVLKDVEMRRQVNVIQGALVRLAEDFRRFDERMQALARHIDQAHRDVQDVQVSSRKISARFQRIENADFGDEDGEALPPSSR